MRRHLETDNANVHRGAHLLSARATESYEGARDKVARFINAKAREEVVFTRGATEAINLVAQVPARVRLTQVPPPALRHDASAAPWPCVPHVATRSIALAQSWGSTLEAGDEIVLSEAEHHSNLVPWQILEQKKGLKLR